MPWNCNILALKYLDSAINDDIYINNTWDNTIKLKNEQKNILKNYFNDWEFEGVNFIPWIWIKLPSENIANKLYTISKNNGMPIRHGKMGYNKSNYIRIAIRNIKNFNKLIEIWIKEINN